MPIIVNGKVFSTTKVTEPVKPKPVVRAAEPQPSSPNPEQEGTKMVVNGKEMKIGKKSPYLLDMFTIDDDI